LLGGIKCDSDDGMVEAICLFNLYSLKLLAERSVTEMPLEQRRFFILLLS
jgi:hypothetical protein